MTHELKTWPEFFQLIVDGRKNFELRRDDRLFVEGDILRLREWVPRSEEYTGRVHIRKICYVLRDAPTGGLTPGYCILGLGPQDSSL